MRAYLTLADIAAKTDRLAVACSRCDRRDRYSLAELIAKHGPRRTRPGTLTRALRRLPAAGEHKLVRALRPALSRAGRAVQEVTQRPSAVRGAPERKRAAGWLIGAVGRDDAAAANIASITGIFSDRRVS
jgi:hypothetical protein